MVGPTPWYDLLTKNHLERRCMDLYDLLLDNQQQKGLLLGRYPPVDLVNIRLLVGPYHL